MSKPYTTARELHERWMEDAAYVKAYESLDDEFDLAAAFIRARCEANLTQAEIAERMGTTKAVIARLESGTVKPSTRTLERFAKATGTRLRIAFDRLDAA